MHKPFIIFSTNFLTMQCNKISWMTSYQLENNHYNSDGNEEYLSYHVKKRPFFSSLSEHDDETLILRYIYLSCLMQMFIDTDQYHSIVSLQ